jgi:acyl-CoA carboxylase subunit beta
MPGSLADTADCPSWELCPGCRAIIFRKRLERAIRVCPECSHHLMLTAWERLNTLLDDGSITALPPSVPDTDPLGFVGYPQRRAQARRRTGLVEAVVCATGAIGGWPLVVAAMDFRFMGGSLGSAVGELITQAAELALIRRLPMLIVSASGGARMHEGALSLMQMAKTSQILGQLHDAGMLTISLVTDPTFGGVAASYSTLADVIIAEPGARLGFAGPRVIAQTTRAPLPDSFQTAEFLLAHGLIDMLCPRTELRPRLARLLAAASGSRGHHEQVPVVVTDSAELDATDPWEAVRQARDINRPTCTDYISRITEDFVALSGDRLGKECPAVIGGLASLGGAPVMVIGTQKGHSAVELTAHTFGMVSPAGYRKAARLMRLAAKLGIPVITLIDTPGAHPGIEAEENGQAHAIAENLKLMAGLPVPVVAVVIGEGGSGGALALAVADRVLIFSNAVYSVISPEGCAAILWNDPAAAPEAAAALRIDARHLLDLGVVDGVIPEPAGGTQADYHVAAQRLRQALSSTLAELTIMPLAELRDRRRARFRRFGAGVRVD